MNSGNLLVVDWDFWFTNPLEWGTESEQALLFDWGHRENAFMRDHIWSSRAMGFIGNDLPLPKMNDGWQTFADRIQYDPDGELLYSDSNLFSGLTEQIGSDYSQVWLFDAHHDLYRFKSLNEWIASGTAEGIELTCEDWMFVHAYAESELVWRFPPSHEHWMEDWKDGNWSPPEGVNLDWGPDTGDPIEPFFDQIYVCRSGCWVPSWNDEEFEQFLGSFGMDMTQMDDIDFNRQFDYEQARKDWEQARRVREEMMKEAEMKASQK